MKKNFYKAWLLSGVLQIFFSYGAPQGQASETLLSQSPIQESHEATEINQDSIQAMPVRIPRTFFRDSISGELSIHSRGSQNLNHTSQSLMEWKEEATTLPPPKETPNSKVLADFRDYTGCA